MKPKKTEQIHRTDENRTSRGRVEDGAYLTKTGSREIGYLYKLENK